MKIRNHKSLDLSSLRKIALGIVEAGLKSIDTKTAIKKNVRFDREKNQVIVQDKKFLVKEGGKIYVVGVGKCSLEAASALEEIIGNKISHGIVLDVHKGRELSRIEAYQGDHPLSSPQNIAVTGKIIALLESLTKDDLAIFVISGGGSALLSQPQGYSYIEEANIINCLLKSGADIEKINMVRKHLSLARGGFLAKYAYPAKVVSLIFSDVPGHPIEVVASGPTVKDTTTLAQAEKIMKKYKVLEKCNLAEIKLIETPKEDKYFEKNENFVIVSNDIALKAMAEEAKSVGFKSKIINANFSGEARTLGEQIIKNLGAQENKTVTLYGGESVVVVAGNGKGGRNQELVLSALRFVKEGEILVSVASDGRDNCMVAGAICDAITKNKAKNLGLDIEKYLKDNDSYNFFAKTGDYILTGDTGSNVADLVIGIKSGSENSI